MLEGIFGNKTAEKVLLHIYHHGESYGSAISSDMNLPRNPIVHQLERFEKAQILISKQVGRSRVYRFNDRYPLTAPVRELIKKVYESLTTQQREKLFHRRRRPRMKGKPIIE